MTKIYHFTNELIILDKIYKKNKYEVTQTLMLRALGASVAAIYDAHEIWFYIDELKAFEAYKNKNGTKTLLAAYLEDNGINTSYATYLADTSDGETQLMRFHSEKDEFVFKLKYS